MPPQAIWSFVSNGLNIIWFCILVLILSIIIASNHGCYAGGLIWINQWNSLQHPVASAFLAVVYSDYMLTSQTPTFSCSGKSYTPSDLRKFAMSQVYHLSVFFFFFFSFCFFRPCVRRFGFMSFLEQWLLSWPLAPSSNQWFRICIQHLWGITVMYQSTNHYTTGKWEKVA